LALELVESKEVS